MLDLNEIERDHRIITERPLLWWKDDYRKAGARLLEQIPALVEELRETRATITELRERNERLVDVLHTDGAEIEHLRAKLRHVQAERDTLQALEALFCGVDDYLYKPDTNDYPAGHCNPDRLEALRILFLGMLVDTEEEAND